MRGLTGFLLGAIAAVCANYIPRGFIRSIAAGVIVGIAIATGRLLP